LDATNIVTPTLSIITAIQIDHTKILGDTIEKIALEKAGIMKPGVDVLVGPGCPMDVMRVRDFCVLCGGCQFIVLMYTG
jgi:dihydrofolate synthase/folylpolyglutamate synthase